MNMQRLINCEECYVNTASASPILQVTANPKTPETIRNWIAGCLRNYGRLRTTSRTDHRQRDGVSI